MEEKVTKKKKAIFDRRSIFFSIIVLIMFAVIVGLQLKSMEKNLQSTSKKESSNIDYRDLGNKLRSAGIIEEAILKYEEYMKHSDIPNDEKAKLAYTIGKMYVDAGKYEKALSWLYQVEMFDPKSEVITETNSKIVNCLERLKKLSAAEYALESRTSLDKKDKEGERGKVVAKIGNDEITLAQVEEALDELPPYLKERFTKGEGKLEFAKKYVADELLYRKAMKLQYNEDPEIRKKIEKITREILVQKVIEKELSDKVKVEESDLKLYYQAHPEKYKEKPKAKVSLIKLANEEESKQIFEELKGGGDFEKIAKEKSLDESSKEKGGKIDNWVIQGEDSLNLGEIDKVSDAIFNTEQNNVTEPIQIGENYYIFKVHEKVDEKLKPFEEVKELLHRDYYTEKMQSAYQNLIKETLSVSDVKFYPEVLSSESKSSESKPSETESKSSESKPSENQ